MCCFWSSTYCACQVPLHAQLTIQIHKVHTGAHKLTAKLMSVTLLPSFDTLHAFASVSSLQQLLLQWPVHSCPKGATCMMANSTCSCSCDCFAGIHGYSS